MFAIKDGKTVDAFGGLIEEDMIEAFISKLSD